MNHRFGVAVPLLWPIDAEAMGQTVITKGTKLLEDKSAGAAHKIEQEWRAAFSDASTTFAHRKTDKIQLDHLHRQNPSGKQAGLLWESSILGSRPCHSGLKELVVKLAQQEAMTITIPETWEKVLEGKHKREASPKAVHQAHRHDVIPRPQGGSIPGCQSKARKRSAAYQKATDWAKEGVCAREARGGSEGTVSAYYNSWGQGQL